MPIAAKLDDWGLPAWIALMVLSFIVWWPLGLVILHVTLSAIVWAAAVVVVATIWRPRPSRMT